MVHHVPITSKEAVTACLLFGIGEVSTRVALTCLLSEKLTETAGRGIYRFWTERAGNRG